MRDLAILLDGDSKVSLYEQIYLHIRGEIRSGRMSCGVKLPSARALAQGLKVSRSTVDLAYAKLQDEGYIHPIPCKGFYVCDVATLYELPVEEKAKSLPAKEQKSWKYDFSLNGIDADGFPFAVWNRMSRAAILDAEQQMFRQGQPQGDPGLREALREYLHYARGVECRASQIVIGAGNDYLLMLLAVILGKNRCIAMENPTYLNAFRCFKTLGYPVVSVGMDSSGMKVEELSGSGADIAYVMPSHQFPTGVVMPMERRTQLIRWAREQQDRYIIEDDYDSEFRYMGHPLPALQGSDGGEHVIYLGTFSKSIAPSIRISYMVLPKTLLPLYEQRASCFSTTVSRVDQRVLEQFIRQGQFERHLNRMRGIYKIKHDRLVERLKEKEEALALSGENAGLHIMLQAKKGLDVKLLRKKAAGQGIGVYCLSDYFQTEGDQPMEDQLLLGYASLPAEQIDKAVDALFLSWKELC